MPLIVACGLLLAIANAIGNENLYSDANGTFSLVGVI
jgi:fructose-specific phosphotransferase system IIC component